MIPSSLWLPSASSASRSLNCPGSVVLPRDKRGSSATSEMNRGSYLHLLLERLLAPREPQLARLAALAKLLPSDEVSALEEALSHLTPRDILLDGSLVGAEVALAYHPETDSARFLGESIEREYRQHGWDPHTEIPGSADVILQTRRGSFVVVDFKTAHYDNQVSYSWKPQLDLLALMAARFYGLDSISHAVCLVFDDGRLRWVQMTHLDALDLDGLAVTVRDAVRRWHLAEQAIAAGTPPDTKPGPWCDHCASKALCPSWTLMARQMASGELGLSPDTIAALTPEEGGLVWERLQHAEGILEMVKEQLQSLASRRPLILPNGLRLRHQICERDNFSDKATMEYLVATYGAEKARDCARWKFSKTELHRVLGDEEAKRTLTALRKNGAISKTTYSQFKPVPAKEE